MCLKIAVNEKNVNPLDISFFRTLVMLLGTGILVLIMGENLYVKPDQRLILLLRCLFGTIGFTCFAFGIALVPLIV